MPFVDFVSSDDRVSLWYITNTLQGTVSEFDPRKPTIIMLHPIFLDSTWLNTQMEDPRLNDKFNIIAFDMRSCGRSYCKPSGAHDTWVDAADLAFAHLVRGSRLSLRHGAYLLSRRAGFGSSTLPHIRS